jgi:glycosyltransferase involved in cell wall biosynthesis
MRVCYFIPMLDYATGWGRWTFDLLDEILRHGVEPVLIVPRSQKVFHGELGLDKYETYFWGPEPYLWFQSLHRINARGLRDLFTLRRNFPLLRDISLIHAADMYPWGYFGLQLKRKIHVPLIVTNHSRLLFHPRWSPLDYLLCGKTLEECDIICSVSQWGSDQVMNAYPSMPKDRFVVIHNGVNVKRIVSEAEKLVTIRRPVGKRPILLSVTRFIRLKNIETSVLAFLELKSEYPEAIYYIVGPHTVQSYVEEIEKLIRLHNIRDVHLVGKTSSLDELYGYYSIADVMIHTSSSESFPLIFFEASCFGLPVVATRVGGVPEVVEDGVNGILVDVGDHRQVAEAVLRILSDRSLAARLGEAGMMKASLLTTRKVAMEYAELYRTLIEGRTI